MLIPSPERFPYSPFLPHFQPNPTTTSSKKSSFFPPYIKHISNSQRVRHELLTDSEFLRTYDMHFFHISRLKKDLEKKLESTTTCFLRSYLLIEELWMHLSSHVNRPSICFLANSFNRCRSIPTFYSQKCHYAKFHNLLRVWAMNGLQGPMNTRKKWTLTRVVSMCCCCCFSSREMIHQCCYLRVWVKMWLDLRQNMNRQ